MICEYDFIQDDMHKYQFLMFQYSIGKNEIYMVCF